MARTPLTMNEAPSERNQRPTQETIARHPTASTASTAEEALSWSVPQEHTITAHEEDGRLNLVDTDQSEVHQDGWQPKAIHAFDLLGHRRKRRKVKQELDGQVLESRNDAPVLGESTQEASLALSPQETAQRRETEPEPGSEARPAAQPSTPKTRRGRPPKSTFTEKEKTSQSNAAKQCHQENKNGSGLQNSPGPNEQKTRRKKTMQISANGKLFEEPSKPQKASSPPKDGITTSIALQTGKNLTLNNGRFTQTYVVVLRYHDVSAEPVLFGSKVEEILSQSANPNRPIVKVTTEPISRVQGHYTAKTTHPFFLGKARQRPECILSNTSNANTSGHTTDNEDPAADVKLPVPWKDLVFKSNKPASSKDLHLEKPVWPPLRYQHVRPIAESGCSVSTIVTADRKHKSKTRGIQINDEENLLAYLSHLLSKQSEVQEDILRPKRVCTTTRNALAQTLQAAGPRQELPAISAARAHALNNLSAFDRAEAPGPLPWTQQYEPVLWEHVLQPQCHILYDWLRGLTVHQVKHGLDPTQQRPAAQRRRRQKKRDDELDDFIVDDSQYVEATKIKNAIIIVGPNGCGKTASVHAVAKQLGFEVFELHAGMRRSQKDIFDRVGDMAQNHMVQRGQPLSRDSSVVNEHDTFLSQEESAQPSVVAFLAGGGKKKTSQASRPVTPQPSKEQKQSLILFEEVDHIFEDDRGFWAGVQSLIQNSRRPVVLTCNDLQNIPMGELDLHATLTYVAPRAEVVSEYLTYVAAAEGHLIQPKAVELLYRSKGCDLRATMTELDFWCQMAVGSEKCGLDWLADSRNANSSTDQPKERIFSKDTFHEGLDLMPELCRDLEDSMHFWATCLDIPPHEILETGVSDCHRLETSAMQMTTDVFEVMSIAEMLDPSMRPFLYAPIFKGKQVAEAFTERAQLVQAKIIHQARRKGQPLSFDCLQPLNAERPTFPPSQGRLAPSLDLPRSVLATDIAPYVRSIAAFDSRLEQQRDELFSSQGKKTRTTRAARAAAEGGDKASTRRERWFPADLDLVAILKTGNNWPQWLNDYEEDLNSDTNEVMNSNV